MTLLSSLTKWIDKTPSKVPKLKRIVAYAIDWALGGILTGLPIVLLYAGVTKRNDFFSDFYVFSSLGYSPLYAYTGFVLCLICALFYYVYIPIKKYPGQTLGKRIMGLKIVNDDLSPVSKITMLKRQVIGLMILEGVSLVISSYTRQILTLATGIYLEYYIGVVVGLITIISCMLFFSTPSQKSFHDYLFHTKVVLDSEVYKPKTKNKKATKKNYSS